MTDKLIIDVSSNQVHPIAWAKVKAAGVDAVILKATEGVNYANPFFAEDLKGCNAAKLPVLAYHFAAFGGVNQEVEAFTKVAGARSRVLDIETSTDLVWANHFFDVLKATYAFANDELLLYGSAATLPRKGANARLWVADYGADPKFGVCWQYTRTGKILGIANDVDLSRWTGTDEEFTRLFG